MSNIKKLRNWREDKSANSLKKSDYPSIYDYIHENKIYTDEELNIIVKYIESGEEGDMTSQMAFPCVVTGKEIEGSSCLILMTDGVWEWRSDLVHYLKVHNLKLPDDFYNHIMTTMKQRDNI